MSATTRMTAFRLALRERPKSTNAALQPLLRAHHYLRAAPCIGGFGALCIHHLNGVDVLSSEGDDVTVFLMADAASSALKGQKIPDGFYNIELMVKAVLRKGKVLLCGTCMDARGIQDDYVVEGAQRSTMKELAQETREADKVMVF